MKSLIIATAIYMLICLFGPMYIIIGGCFYAIIFGYVGFIVVHNYFEERENKRIHEFINGKGTYKGPGKFSQK